MIDPIRDPAYHDYQNKKQSKKVSGSNTEKGKFNLDYAEEGVLYEPPSDEEKETSGAEKKQAGSFQASAALELRELTETDSAPAKKAADSQPSLTDSLRTFFARAKQMLRRLWSTIWESTPAKKDDVVTDEELHDAKDAAADEPTEPAGSVTLQAGNSANGPDAADKTPAGNMAAGTVNSGTDKKTGAQDTLHAGNDARILNALKSGDHKNFRSLLSEDGKRTPARNSSLLTYYDARGNLISPDASVQQRVLHGDRGSMKR